GTYGERNDDLPCTTFPQRRHHPTQGRPGRRGVADHDHAASAHILLDVPTTVQGTAPANVLQALGHHTAQPLWNGCGPVCRRVEGDIVRYQEHSGGRLWLIAINNAS